MIRKKIIGYIATAAILTMGVGAGVTATANTQKADVNNIVSNHVLLAQQQNNNGNKAVVVSNNSKVELLDMTASGNSPVKAYLKDGQMVTINSVSGDYSNVTVQGTGMTGYILSSNINKVTNTTNTVQQQNYNNNGNKAVVINSNSKPELLDMTASGNSPIKAYLSVGQMLTINSTSGDYCNVTVQENGIKGYILNSNVKKITSGVNSPFSPMNTNGQVINVSTIVHLRSNATMNSSIIANLPNSTSLKILGKKGNWYKVSVGGQTGFIYQLYVSTNSTGSAMKPTTSTNNSGSAMKPTTSTNNSGSAMKPTTSTNNSGSAMKPTTSTNNNGTTTKPATSNNGITNSQGSNNSAIVPGNNIIYSAQSYAVPANKVLQMLNGKYKSGQKEVFLTFDDGPSSTYTPQILKTLNQYGVHGTFFILGQTLQSKTNQNILKQELMDGNAIANHSYTHNYSTLYPGNSININLFMNEFNKTESMMKSILGSNFNSKVLRMPGGENSRQYYKDKNLPAFKNTLAKAGITSIDWNAENGDATGKTYTAQQLVQNAINQSKGKPDVVLLMHDVKANTAQALPQIIQYYKSQGYTFKVISNAN
ncbi:MAG: polysaccharide deacetylase family protein [Sarcina sp.]